MSDNQQLATNWFSKPGDSLVSLMQQRGISSGALAQILEGGLGSVRGLIDGSLPINAGCAAVLAKAVGGTQEFWIKRQENYEHSLERAVTAAIFDVDEWLDKVPNPGPRRRSKPNDATALRDEVRRRMAFFNVATLHTWQERYGRLCADTHFRKSATYKSGDAPSLLWLRRGELEANLVPTRSWVAENLKDRLGAIRKLSKISHPARFLPKLRILCAEAGVALAVVKTPPGCHASGAIRLVTSDKAMMLLSFRHRADDHFWFTVFHEIGHLLLHRAETFVDSDETPENEMEREANEFAAKCIVPEKRLSEFYQLAPDRDSVLRFSVSIGVSPGLIVGQMQNRKMIQHNKLNSLKRYWKWEDIDPALV